DSGGNTVQVTELTNYFSATPTITVTNLPVTTFAPPAQALQPGGNWTMFPSTTTAEVRYRNGHLVTAMASGSAADGYNLPKGYWYQVDVSGGSTVLFRQGVIDPGPGALMQRPSVAEDIHGNLGFTWMEASPSEYVSMYVGSLDTTGVFTSYAAAP